MRIRQAVSMVVCLGVVTVGVRPARAQPELREADVAPPPTAVEQPPAMTEPIVSPPAPAPVADPAPVAVVAPPPPAVEEAPAWAPSLELYGYMQVHYRGHVETDGDGRTTPDDFRVQRARVGLKGEVLHDVSFDLELDPRAPLITGLLRDAYISLDFVPHHRLRIGQQKTQFGWENVESSTRLYTVNRAEFSDSIARGLNLRDVGLGLLGRWGLGGGFRLEYAFNVVNGDGLNVQEDRTHFKNYWGRIGGRYKRPGLKIWLGVSGGLGDQFEEEDPLDPTDDFTVDFRRAGVDLEVDQTWFFLATEWGVGHEVTPDETADVMGYYVLVAGKTPWHVGPLVRYDTFEDYERLTLGAYWGEPDALLRVLFNYELRREEEIGAHDHRYYGWVQLRFEQWLTGGRQASE